MSGQLSPKARQETRLSLRRFIIYVHRPSSSRKGGVPREHSASSQACQGSQGARDCVMVTDNTERRFTAACMQAEQKMKAGASSQQADADRIRAPAQLEASRPLTMPHVVQLATQRTPGNIEQGISADGLPLPETNSTILGVQHIYSNELAMASAAEEASPAEWALPSGTATEQVRWGYRR